MPTNPIESLVARAAELRAVRARNGNGFIIFDDNPVVRQEIASLAKDAGLAVVESPTQTFYNGRPVGPHIWVGKAVSNITPEDLLASLE